MSDSACLYWIEAADNAQTNATRTEAPCGDDPAAASHPFCRRLIELMEERGLLTRVFMALQLCPPLVVTRDEIDQMVTIVDDSLSLAEREFGFS
jgi:adenosylmethionine-8-amino-7-oxononanoate aminotransferase